MPRFHYAITLLFHCDFRCGVCFVNDDRVTLLTLSRDDVSDVAAIADRLIP